MDSAEERLYIEAMSKISRKIVLPKGTMLSYESVYYLIDGVCALVLSSREGGEYSFIYFRKNMLLNFTPTVSRCGNWGSVTRKRVRRLRHVIRTKTECTLLCVSGQAFIEHMDKDPVLHRLLVHSLTENWVNLLSLSTGITSSSAGSRVCQLILDSIPPSPPYVIPRYLTYAEIAAHLSMHPITTTKIFRSLCEQKVLVKKGSTLTVTDIERLESLADGLLPLCY